MTTAEEYMDLASEAYLVDPLKRDPPYTKGHEFHVGAARQGQRYVVLDSDHNPVNGFQAMAVAPVVNGVPDTSQVTVSFAGTNPDHRADVLADVQSVVDGRQGFGTQVVDAERFAERVRQGYPGASFSTAGHSLGGFLALSVAAENGWSATTFNGPDPWEGLSPQAREWLRGELAAGRKPLVNYVNEWDLVGNLYEDKTGAAVFVRDEPGRPVLEYHNIGSGGAFGFEADGSVTGAGVGGRRFEVIIENALDVSDPVMRGVLDRLLPGMAAAVRNPGVRMAAGGALSGLIVMVNTVSALGLAGSITGTIQSLVQIKLSNERLIPRMQEGLTAAMNAVSVLPYVTTWDVENCVDVKRLHVHQNIDEDAVAEVDRLVDDHIATATRLGEGILRSVDHALEQDRQWAFALAFDER